VPEVPTQPDETEVAVAPVFVCRHCGAPMIVIEISVRR
jgi:hypothetical protein